MLDGKDPFLLSLSKKKKLFVPYDENGWPMDKRVGHNCTVIVGKDDLDRRLGHDHPHTADCGSCDWTWRKVPAGRPQARRDAQALPHFPDEDLAAQGGPEMGPDQEGFHGRRDPRDRPTPTATCTAFSAT